MAVTQVFFDPRTDLPSGILGNQPVTVKATPTRIRETGTATIYPNTVTFSSVTADLPMHLQSTDGTWAWAIGVYQRLKVIDIRTVFVTGATANWVDLVDVDPDTFLPVIAYPTIGSQIADLDTRVDALELGGGGGIIVPPVPVVDATTTTKGIIQLGGDLAGTATAPTVPGLLSKTPLPLGGSDGQALVKIGSGTAWANIGGFSFIDNGDGTFSIVQNGVTTPTLNLTSSGLPTISGNNVVGATLTATGGTWNATPDATTYQWARNGAVISGATTSMYTTTSADVGGAITVSVAVTKAGYVPGSATSAPVTVTAVTLSSTTAPSISGTSNIGSALTVNPGTWSATPDTVTYQWRRAGAAISGATTTTYTLVTADAGAAITVTATAVKAGYTTATATSAAVTPAAATSFSNSTAPTISGTPQVGSVLTASNGTWSQTPDSYTYQWRRADTPIAGATSSTYTLVSADSGSALKVVVTATKSGQTSVSATSAATTSITTPSGPAAGNVTYTLPNTPTTVGAAPLDTTANAYQTGTAFTAKSSKLAAFTGPIPTNAWWTNLFMGANPVAPLPYMVRPGTAGLDIAYPTNHIVSATAEYTAFNPSLALNAVEAVSPHTITAFDDLTATVKWAGTTTSLYQTACIAQGAGLVAMQYTGLTPTVLTPGAAVLQVNGANPGSPVTGTSFKLVLNSGVTWMLYASSTITLSTSTSAGLTATAPFTGTLQVGVLPSSSAQAALDAAGGCWITGGTVTYTVNSGTATIGFNYTKSGTGTLLTYALPHHIDSLATGTQAAGVTMRTIKGTAQGMTGSGWTLTETLPTIQFAPPQLDTGTNTTSALLSSLSTDINGTYALTVSDPYFTGKYLARWARLAQIADEMGQPALAATARAKYKPDLIQWLTGANTDYFVYDTVWKGVISAAGQTSQGADFGNGIYNDHHFHYGYFVYAAAVLAKNDTSFVTTYGARVTHLLRDYMNPSTTDTFSAKLRHKDHYAGHSWAQGLDNTGDPKNQESTSEAINAYYAAWLWGAATSNTQAAITGLTMLATEIRSTKKYWHIKSADTIYTAPFTNNKVVGVVWGSKVDYATFFSGAAECIHGIQMIPYTPAMELSLTSDWVTEQYPVVKDASFGRTFPISGNLTTGGTGYTGQFTSSSGQQYSNYLPATGGTGTGLQFNVNITGGKITEVFVCTDQHGSGYTDGDVITLNASGGTGAKVTLVVAPTKPWAGVIYGDHAVIDPATAWTELAAFGPAVTNWDDGNSRTNMLHWVASRPAVTSSGGGGLGTGSLGTDPVGA